MAASVESYGVARAIDNDQLQSGIIYVVRIIQFYSCFIFGAVAVILTVFFSVTSWQNALELVRGLPCFDQWRVIRQYVALTEGQFSFGMLFQLHNEHRIITTRAILFADAALFSMKGLLPLVVTYLAFAVFALLATLAATAERAQTGQAQLSWLAVLVTAIGFSWSICHWVTLGLAFQIAFAFVHLFAMITLVALNRSFENGARYGWVALAIAADFLTIYSLGSGLLMTFPLIWLAIVRRQMDRVFWLFISVHFAMVALYFVGFPFSKFLTTTAAAPFESRLVAFFSTLGLVSNSHSFAAGLIGFVIFAAAAIWVTWMSLFKNSPSRGLMTLVGMAGFCCTEALSVAMARAGLGGADPRHTTVSVIFFLSLGLIAWQSSSYLPSKTGALIAKNVTIVSAIVLLILANDPIFKTYWRSWIERTDIAIAQVRVGNITTEAKDCLWISRGEMLQWILDRGLPFLRERHLSPFDRK